MATTAVQHAKQASEYETIYILAPNVEPADADKVSGRVAEVVDRLGAKLTRVDVWGRKRLAYPIRKHSRGIFVYLKYVAHHDLVAELERNLRLLDPVMRFQTVLLERGVDIASVVVDPEDVKFIPVEPSTEADEDEGLEQRLGLAAPTPRRPPEADNAEAAGGEAEGATDPAAASADAAAPEETTAAASADATAPEETTAAASAPMAAPAETTAAASAPMAAPAETTAAASADAAAPEETTAAEEIPAAAAGSEDSNESAKAEGDEDER